MYLFVIGPIYALYGGQSTDERGEGKFLGLIENTTQAKKYWKITQSPYSVGKVVGYYKHTKMLLSTERDWQVFEAMFNG